MEIDLRTLNGQPRDFPKTIRIEGELAELDGVRLSGSMVAEFSVECSPEEIFLDGELCGKQWLICSRSLEEFEHSFVVPLRVKIAFDARAGLCELEEGEDEEYLLRVNSRVLKVDLSECMRQQILLNEPISPMKNPEEEFRWSLEEAGEPVKKIDPRWGELEKLKKRMESPSQVEGKQENPHART